MLIIIMQSLHNVHAHNLLSYLERWTEIQILSYYCHCHCAVQHAQPTIIEIADVTNRLRLSMTLKRRHRKPHPKG